MENFAYGEINEQSLSNPHPRQAGKWMHLDLHNRGN